MVQEGINGNNGMELRDANIKRNCQSFLLALTENFQKKQGKNIFWDIRPIWEQNIGKFKEFYSEYEIKWMNFNLYSLHEKSYFIII